jgi:SAM-dependent methyltransferase
LNLLFPWRHSCLGSPWRTVIEVSLTAFDALAADYDATFTHTPLGEALRAFVWARLDDRLRDCRYVLELGCGTGEDAVHLARKGIAVRAIDSSAAMIRVAREKAKHSGCAQRIDFRCESLESYSTGAEPTHASGASESPLFDGVVSNFGALNCVPDLSQLAKNIAARVVTGSPLIWVIMGRHVPWEWLWYASRGDLAKARRRLKAGGVSWRGMEIRYPTPSDIVALLRPYFAINRVAPLGIALPPSYAAAWLNRSPRGLRMLTWLEKQAQRSAFLARLSDHFIVEATRLPGPGCVP